MANLRKHFRYAISAPAKFNWGRGAEADQFHGDGVTKDVGLGSSFLWTSTCPPAGVDIDCQIFLPRIGAHAREIKAVVEGFVARVDAPSSEHNLRGFVVMHRKLEILNRETRQEVDSKGPVSPIDPLLRRE